MSEESIPSVAVVIPNHNGSGFLRECLTSIKAQDYHRLTAIVVDNGSTDGSREIVKNEFAFVELLAFQDNTGVGAENAGIELALRLNCDYVFLTDSDTIFLKDTIAGLIKEMDQNPDLGIIAPFQISIPSKLVSALGGTVDWLTFRIRMPSSMSSPSLVDYAGASLVRKSVFQKIGFIEPRFIASWQDVDFGLRANRAGFKVGVVPDSRLLHYGSSTMKAIPGLRGFVRLRNRLILARRNLAKSWLPFIALLTACDLPVQVGVWLANGERKEALLTAVGFLSGLYFLFNGREPNRLLRLSQSLMNGKVRVC